MTKVSTRGNSSLVCFTLSVQTAVGLVWINTMGHWFGGAGQSGFSGRPLIAALVLLSAGLAASLGHLGRPFLAYHALRNPAVSWLSREVLLVPLFTAALVLAAVALLTLLVGCAEEGDEKVIRMGYVSGPTVLLHSAAQEFADRVAQRAGGKLRVRLYPSGQLGDDRETVASYGDVPGEYAAALDGAALIDLTERGVLLASGPKRQEFLQGMVSNDVGGLDGAGFDDVVRRLAGAGLLLDPPDTGAGDEAPPPATDGRAVYAFFPDFGLIAYSVAGEELWRVTTPPAITTNTRVPHGKPPDEPASVPMSTASTARKACGRTRRRLALSSRVRSIHWVASVAAGLDWRLMA